MSLKLATLRPYRSKTNIYIPNEDAHIVEAYSRLIQVASGKISVYVSSFQYFNYWLKVPEDKMQKILAIMDFLYYGTVLVDDIQDYSDMRVGVPTAHLIYGNAKVVNTVNYIITLMWKMNCDFEDLKILGNIMEQFQKCFVSQGIDLFWREHNLCPSEEEYLSMSSMRTHSFLGIGLQLMEHFSENNCKDYTNIVRLYGNFIQVFNDFVNLASPLYSSEKGGGDDITSGTFNFLIVHAIQSQPDDDRILNILKQRTKDVELIRQCIMLIKNCGSFEYTKKYLENLKNEMLKEMDILGNNPFIEHFITKGLLRFEEETYFL